MIRQENETEMSNLQMQTNDLANVMNHLQQLQIERVIPDRQQSITMAENIWQQQPPSEHHQQQ